MVLRRLFSRKYAVLFTSALSIRLVWSVIWLRMFYAKYSWSSYDNHLEIAKYFAGRPGGQDFLGRTPLYSWFLAAFLMTVGQRPYLIAAIQSILSSLTALFPYLVCRRYQLERAGIYGSLLASIDPLLIYYTPQIMSEPFYTFLITLFFTVAIITFETGSLIWATISGIAAGAATMARITFLPYFWTLPIMVFFTKQSFGRFLKQLALIWAGLALLTLPWAMRNYMTHQRFSIAYGFGRGLYEGLGFTKQGAIDLTGEVTRALGSTPKKSEVEWDDIFRNKAIQWIKKNPARYLWIVVRKAINFWRFAPYDPYPSWARWGIGAYSSLVFFLALYGAWSFRGRPVTSALLWIFLLVFTALHALFDNSIRYKVPVEPVLTLWAGVALANLQRQKMSQAIERQ